MQRGKRGLGALCVIVVLLIAGCGGGGGSSSVAPLVGHAIAVTSTPQVGISTVTPTGQVSPPLIPEAPEAFFSSYAQSKSGLIAYGTVSAHTPRTQNFYVADANGGTPRLIASVPVELATRSSLVWSPDETQIAYVVADADGTNVYRADIATAIAQRVTTVNDASVAGSLAWSATDEIYFARGSGADQSIYKVAAQGGIPSLVISPGTLMSLSPDGHKMSFIDPSVDDISGTRIHEMDLTAGTERVVYSAPAGVVLNAAYFDDSNTLLYTRVTQFSPGNSFVGRLNTVTLQSTETVAPSNVFIAALATAGAGVPQIVF